MVAFAKALRQPPAVLSEADSFSDFQKASEQRIFLMMDKELGRCFGPLLANEAVSSMLSKMVLKLEKGEDGEDGEGGEGEEGNEGEDEGKEGEGNKGVCAALLPLLDLEVSDCEQIVALASNAKIADMERKDLAQAGPCEGLHMDHMGPFEVLLPPCATFQRGYIVHDSRMLHDS